MKWILIFLLCISTSAKAELFAVYNFNKNQITAHSGKENRVPIASITKLFTALAILENNLDLTEKIYIQNKTRGRVPNGVWMTRLDLLKAMLIASDNKASEALAHSFPGGYSVFLQFINQYVQNIGLTNTTIVDSSGLLAGNESTAEDLVKLIPHLKNFPSIVEITRKIKETLQFDTNKKKNVKLEIKNTNPDIDKYNIIISKTGYTSKAGRCLLLVVESHNDYYGLVVLGEKSVKSRSETIKTLITNDL